MSKRHQMWYRVHDLNQHLYSVQNPFKMFSSHRKLIFTCLIVLLSGSRSLPSVSSSTDAMPSLRQPFTHQMNLLTQKIFTIRYRVRNTENCVTPRRRKIEKSKFNGKNWIWEMSGDIQQKRITEGRGHIQAAEK